MQCHKTKLAGDLCKILNDETCNVLKGTVLSLPIIQKKRGGNKNVNFKL